MAESLNFTKRSIETLSRPVENSQYRVFHDEEVKGLIIMVFPSGNRVFYLNKKVAGKSEKIKIGRFPEVSVERARKRSLEYLGEIADGINPQDRRREFNNEITFSELYDWYLETYAVPRKKPRSVAEDKGLYKRYLQDWQTKKLSLISREDVTKKHNAIGDAHGKVAANRTLALIKAMFNKAISLHKWQKTNPATGILKFKETSRERFLLPNEIGKFLEALSYEGNEIARDYMLLSLITGARKSNVLAMQWKDINLDALQWKIPDTKNHETHIVPLHPHAAVMLKQRQKETDGKWVFPGIGKSGHLYDPKKAWQRVLKRAKLISLLEIIGEASKCTQQELAISKQNALADVDASLIELLNVAKELKLETRHVGLSDLRIHDLRRTVGSWLATAGASEYIIGKTLGHKDSKSTKIYARMNIDPVRESLNTVVSAILVEGGIIKRPVSPALAKRGGGEGANLPSKERAAGK